MRFAWASRREPHTQIGKGAPKWLKRDLLRKIDLVKQVKYEPRLMQNRKQNESTELEYRVAAVVEAEKLELELDHAHCELGRTSKKNLYLFLRRLKEGAIPQLSDHAITRIALLYEWARFQPKPFTLEELQEFRHLLDQLKALIRKHRHEVTALSRKWEHGTTLAEKNVAKTTGKASQRSAGMVVRRKEKNGFSLFSNKKGALDETAL